MCGIVGYIGPRQAVNVLLPALRRLEYRGYDSAGIATVNGNSLQVCKSVGKIVRLEAALGSDPPQGSVGIAHTRWATHGRPSDANAHPHVDCGLNRFNITGTTHINRCLAIVVKVWMIR